MSVLCSCSIMNEFIATKINGGQEVIFVSKCSCHFIAMSFTRRTGPIIDCITSDSNYTRFRYPLFHISAVLFQYHEEHQYPIRGHVRNCRAGPLSCARSFSDSPHHFDFGDCKLRPLMVCHSEDARAYYTFSVLRFFDTRGNSHERNPPAMSHLYLRCLDFEKMLLT
jgi:hypothetical protein